MSIIDLVIPPASFEIIRDRIGEILFSEIATQYEYSGQEWANVKRVYIGRYVPFQESELPAINIGVGKIDLDGQTVIQSDGTTTFFIDVVAGATGSDEVDGAAMATADMQRLVALCRGIIEHTEYKTLAFVPPFIMFRRFSQILFNPAETKDLSSVASGRLVLMVKAPENNGPFIPRTIGSYQTIVKLHESEKGYLYFGPPEAAEGDAPVLDLILDSTL